MYLLELNLETRHFYDESIIRQSAHYTLRQFDNPFSSSMLKKHIKLLSSIT